MNGMFMATYSIKDAAHYLETNSKELMNDLRSRKWINRDNIPYREIVLDGLMVRKKNHFKDRHDNWQKVITPRLTVRGLVQLRHLRQESMHDQKSQLAR